MSPLRDAALGTFAVLAVIGCGGQPMPKWPVSSAAELCADPSLAEGDFCMPARRIEGWLKSGKFIVADAARSPSGLTSPYKLRLELPNGRSISAKFKRAPDDLEAFNNSPRREIAAYEMQKLFLDQDQYVVPPTVLTCLPVAEHKNLMPELEAHEGCDCAIGVLAYWVEGISDVRVLDADDWARDPVYRDNVGNLNALTVLIGHQDNIGNNFYRAKDPARPRVFSVDNGLAFGAMGDNPVRWFSSQWSSVRVAALPAKTIARLGHVDHSVLERFRVVAQLEQHDGTFLTAALDKPIDANEGVRRKGGIIQLGLTTDEITDVHLRLVKMLGEVDSGNVAAGQPATSSSRPQP